MSNLPIITTLRKRWTPLPGSTACLPTTNSPVWTMLRRQEVEDCLAILDRDATTCHARRSRKRLTAQLSRVQADRVTPAR